MSMFFTYLCRRRTFKLNYNVPWRNVFYQISLVTVRVNRIPRCRKKIVSWLECYCLFTIPKFFCHLMNILFWEVISLWTIIDFSCQDLENCTVHVFSLYSSPKEVKSEGRIVFSREVNKFKSFGPVMLIFLTHLQPWDLSFLFEFPFYFWRKQYLFLAC